MAVMTVIVAALLWALKLMTGWLHVEREKSKRLEAIIKRDAETAEEEAEIDSDWSDVERTANENLDDIPPFLRKRRLRDAD